MYVLSTLNGPTGPIHSIKQEHNRFVLVQVMVGTKQLTSHYLKQRCPGAHLTTFDSIQDMIQGTAEAFPTFQFYLFKTKTKKQLLII